MFIALRESKWMHSASGFVHPLRLPSCNKHLPILHLHHVFPYYCISLTVRYVLCPLPIGTWIFSEPLKMHMLEFNFVTLTEVLTMEVWNIAGKAAFKQTKRLRKKHETRYFWNPHLYKNIAIYPLCSRKNVWYCFAWPRLNTINVFVRNCLHIYCIVYPGTWK